MLRQARGWPARLVRSAGGPGGIGQLILFLGGVGGKSPVIGVWAGGLQAVLGGKAGLAWPRCGARCKGEF